MTLRWRWGYHLLVGSLSKIAKGELTEGDQVPRREKMIHSLGYLIAKIPIAWFQTGKNNNYFILGKLLPSIHEQYSLSDSILEKNQGGHVPWKKGTTEVKQ